MSKNYFKIQKDMFGMIVSVIIGIKLWIHKDEIINTILSPNLANMNGSNMENVFLI